MGRISALTELTSLASNDYLIVLDSSANIAKKISVANAFGVPEATWTATGETWTYSSWTSGTRIGIITVPTNATTKYQAGNRIKFSQTTGGTKYGIIHEVSATTLTIFFPVGTTLNNETISTPMYSPLDTPYGFDKTPSQWSITLTDSTIRAQATPTTSTWYNPASLSLSVGIGKWKPSGKVCFGKDRSTQDRMDTQFALSTSASSVSDNELLWGAGSTNPVSGSAAFNSWISNLDTDKIISVAATSTYYPIICTAFGGSGVSIYLLNDTSFTPLTIRLTSAYL